MKQAKRFAALMLALLVSLLPSLSLQAGALYLEDRSGSCTRTVEDGVLLSDGRTGTKLTIAPANGYHGKMDDYAYLADNWVSCAPWASYISAIEEVEVKDGAENFGANCMSYFGIGASALKKVIFSDSVEEIGWNAFYRLNLSKKPIEVDWGQGIKRIESSAFVHSGVTKVILPAIEELEKKLFPVVSFWKRFN